MTGTALCFFYYLSIFAVQSIAALVYLICYFEDLYSTVSSTNSLYLSLRFSPGSPYFIKLLVHYTSLSEILLVLILSSYRTCSRFYSFAKDPSKPLRIHLLGTNHCLLIMAGQVTVLLSAYVCLQINKL